MTEVSQSIRLMARLAEVLSRTADFWPHDMTGLASLSPDAAAELYRGEQGPLFQKRWPWTWNSPGWTLAKVSWSNSAPSRMWPDVVRMACAPVSDIMVALRHLAACVYCKAVNGAVRKADRDAMLDMLGTDGLLTASARPMSSGRPWPISPGRDRARRSAAEPPVPMAPGQGRPRAWSLPESRPRSGTLMPSCSPMWVRSAPPSAGSCAPVSARCRTIRVAETVPATGSRDPRSSHAKGAGMVDYYRLKEVGLQIGPERASSSAPTWPNSKRPPTSSSPPARRPPRSWRRPSGCARTSAAAATRKG